MSVKPKYEGIEKKIFADVYLFFTTYVNGDGSDYFWEECLNSAHMLCSKYEGYSLCSEMLVAVIRDLELKINKK